MAWTALTRSSSDSAPLMHTRMLHTQGKLITADSMVHYKGLAIPGWGEERFFVLQVLCNTE